MSAYAVDPSVESREALKPKVRAFQAINDPKILAMNLGFIGPGILARSCEAVNEVLKLASVTEGKDLDDDDVSKKTQIARTALYTFFEVVFIFCLLAPVVYHTATIRVS